MFESDRRYRFQEQEIRSTKNRKLFFEMRIVIESGMFFFFWQTFQSKQKNCWTFKNLVIEWINFGSGSYSF